MDDFESNSDEGVLVEDEVEITEPPMYKVQLLNDDYTTMEFVVMVLQSIFKKTIEEATYVMLSVHEKGVGTAGVYTKEIAETKIAIVHHLARQNEFPLKCDMEPA